METLLKSSADSFQVKWLETYLCQGRESPQPTENLFQQPASDQVIYPQKIINENFSFIVITKFLVFQLLTRSNFSPESSSIVELSLLDSLLVTRIMTEILYSLRAKLYQLPRDRNLSTVKPFQRSMA